MMMGMPPPLSPEKRAEFKQIAFSQFCTFAVCVAMLRAVPAVLGYSAASS
jgi:hypothetical protein